MAQPNSQRIINEATPLLSDPSEEPDSLVVIEDTERQCHAVNEDTHSVDDSDINFPSLLAVLLLGVFVANADTSLVLATYGEISSEFRSLDNASWLLTGYMLSMCASQPLYGKLSNIYGRKALLLIAYTLFAIGCLICGIAKTMPVVITGRLISGAGGSGMSSVVSFLIADLVPLRDVATYRSYVNVVQTLGRSCGGPIGGLLAEKMGWRWSFLVQCPLTLLAIILVTLKLRITPRHDRLKQEPGVSKDKLGRVDFLGSFIMCIMIITFLLPLSIGGNQVPWTHPLIGSLFGLSFFAALIFAYVELKVAREPIFPLSLLARRDVTIPYVILFLQNIAQTLMMYVVPLYFQVTKSASPSAAGFYLIPAVVGNTLGGLATGYYIRRHAKYRMVTIIGALIAALCHVLTSLRWTGHTSLAEAIYIFPAGIGTGVTHSSTFVAITAGTTNEELAIAGAGLYLCGSLGSLLGVTLASGLLRTVVTIVARQKLPDQPEIIKRALEDVGFIVSLQGRTKQGIVDAYVSGSRANFALAFLACIISSLFGLVIREKRLS